MPAPLRPTQRPAIEWLMELPEGYREKALANSQNSKWKNHLVSGTDRALQFNFDFEDAPEGAEFWFAVCTYCLQRASHSSDRYSCKLPPLNPESRTQYPDEAFTFNNSPTSRVPEYYSTYDSVVRRRIAESVSRSGLRVRRPTWSDVMPITDAWPSQMGPVHDQWIYSDRVSQTPAPLPPVAPEDYPF